MAISPYLEAIQSIHGIIHKFQINKNQKSIDLKWLVHRLV